MKIALINCPMWDIEFPPYNIALLLAILREYNFEADCFDLNAHFYNSKPEYTNKWHLANPYIYWRSEENIKKIIYDWEKDLKKYTDILQEYNILGVTVQSLNYLFTIKFIKTIKEKFPEKVVIFGGPECSRNFNAMHLIEHDSVDAVCLREGDYALPEILTQIMHNHKLNAKGFLIKDRNKKIVDNGDAELVSDLDRLPFADYSFLNNPTTLAISTSRGCINRCTFCQEAVHWKYHRHRTAESGFNEIKSNKRKFHNLKYVYFNDSLINGNIKELDRFSDLMISEDIGVQWGGHTAIREEMSLELLKKMKLAGADRLNYGVESGCDRILRLMNKSYESKLIRTVLDNTKRAKISFSVNIIIGYPGETEKDFLETEDLVSYIKNLTSCIHLNLCLIAKGSYLYSNYEKFGIILPSNDFQEKWYLADGSNTYEIREARLKKLIQTLNARC